ncbi:nitroreductase family deazaflavin-dependent oxidoreductase [Streptomyces sp. NPDC020096]
MPRKLKDVPSPAGLRRHLVRAPIRLYRWRLGWLLGKRFLLLTHTGRTTGQPRQVVLEVAGYDPRSDTYLVASGFGPRAQWYRNICRNPAVTIQVGRSRSPAVASRLTPEASGRAMAQYATQHPRIAAKLMRICGLEVDGTKDDFYLAGRDYVPFVRLTPTSTRTDADSGGTHMNVRPLHGIG